MLTLILLSAYLSRRIDFNSEDGQAFVTLNHSQIWHDLILLFGLIGFACSKATLFGNGARTYFDSEIKPWLARRDVNVSIPSIDLPALPWQLTK